MPLIPAIIARQAPYLGPSADVANGIMYRSGAGVLSLGTLSTILDLIGSAAQGDILYRGAASWACLGAGTSGQFLQTQGAAANPQWAAAAAGAAGSDTQVQFNDGGTALGGDAGLVYNKTNDTLTIAGANALRLRLDAHAAQSANLLEVYNASAALRARITSAGEFSNLQGRTSSEAFGAGASVGADECVAIGAGASASTSMGTAVGRNAAASGASRACAFGISSLASGNRAVAFGANSIASGEGAVAIGNGAAAGGTSVTGNVSIGYNTGTTSNTLGPYVAIGYGALPDANNQGVMGGASGPITAWYFGKGVTHATPPASVTIQPTGGSGTDIAGSDFNVAAGRPSGAGTPGKVSVQTAPTGASGTTLRSLVTALQVDADVTGGNTRLLVYDVDNGTLERVSVGAADSGGSGFKVLRIPN